MTTWAKLLAIFFVWLLIYSCVWAFIGLFVWVFCISFGFTFSWLYVLGLWSASVLLKVLLPKGK